jgi:diguanylate cyclase (GGDEF)-like protein
MPSLGREAIDALTELASAQTLIDLLNAMARARAVLGPQAKDYEVLLVTLARRSAEIDQLQQMIGSDPLTGVANRRGFEQALAREVARQNRTLEAFAVIMLDLDRFKERNDRHGHAVGDGALCTLARACESVVRSTDLVARLGGDEFAVLLPGASYEGACGLAERLRGAIEGAECDHGRLQVSVGVAAADKEAISVQDVMLAADQDLYRDKAARKRSAKQRAA